MSALPLEPAPLEIGAGDGEDQLDRAIEELRGVLDDGEPRPGVLPPMGGARLGAAGAPSSHNVVMSIPVDVQIVLGSTEMSVSELLTLGKGSTVALDRRIGEPVDVVVNGRKVARGEITVLDSDPSRFGVRLTEVATAAED